MSTQAIVVEPADAAPLEEAATIPGRPVTDDAGMMTGREFERRLGALLPALTRVARYHRYPEPDDAVQDSLIKLTSAYDRGTAIGNLGAYAHRTLVNVGIDQIRHRGCRPVVLEDPQDLVRRGALTATSAVAEPGQHLDLLELLDEFRRIDPSVDLVYLASVEGYTHQELADAFGVAVNTISKRISRCIQRLRQARTPVGP